MLRLTDEEINKVYKETTNRDNFYRRGRTQRGYDREIARTQLKKVVERLSVFAKAYDMCIDGFVFPWLEWQVLLKEIE